jgi:hypothetical protein
MHDSLGRTFVDRVTGFSGVATGRVEYLTGCNQLLLSPGLGPDGALRNAEWFDEQRLKLSNRRDRVVLDNGNNPGCDRPAPRR